MASIACQSLPLPLIEKLNTYVAWWGVAHCVESEVADGWLVPSSHACKSSSFCLFFPFLIYVNG